MSAALLLLPALLALSWAAPPGSLEFFSERLAAGSLRLPPTAYRLSASNWTEATLPEQLQLATLSDVPEATCCHHCLNRPACLGTAWRPSDRTCLLSSRRPLPSRLVNTTEPWSITGRLGVAFLDEPCVRDKDCWLTVPHSRCALGTCVCADGFNRTSDAGCAPVGELVPAVGIRPEAASLLEEASAADLPACRQLCRQQPLCLALEFSADASTCRLFVDGLSNNMTVADDAFVTEVMRLSILPAAPPEGFTEVDGIWFKPGGHETYYQASQKCAVSGGILWPGRNISGRREALVEAGVWNGETIWIGLDDLLEEGVFRHSDGLLQDNHAQWNFGEPNDDYGQEDCAHIVDGGVLNDWSCSNTAPYLCQYLGPNVALGQPGWANWYGMSIVGTDGSLSRYMRARSTPYTRYVIELEGVHHVTAVIFVAANRRMNGVEVWVSSQRGRATPEVAGLCVRRTGLFMMPETISLLTCSAPLQGRFIHVVFKNVWFSFREIAVLGTPLTPNHVPLQGAVVSG